MKKKTKAEALQDELFYKKTTAFESMDKAELDSAMKYAVGYKDFLNSCKTEREAVKYAVQLLGDAGFKPYEIGMPVKSGDKFYFNNRGKSLVAFIAGSEPIDCGVRISAAHIDSPRLDLKQHPMFEDNGVGYFKTHYYGGIRKHQWTALPLSLHGVIVKKNGESVDIVIGEDDGDPVFCVSDLLPHLAKEQNKKPLAEAFVGEAFNIIIGTSPYMDNGKPADVSESVKLNLLSILNEKYGICESDFMSAELCATPAAKACDVGFDRWLVGSYGHDDRVCAYPALTALLENVTPTHTIMCILADKEEIGSEGPTGMKSSLMCDIIDELADKLHGNRGLVRSNSKCLSADVNAAFDPNYPDVYEKNNCAMLSCGVAMSKYTGSGGKYSTNDASAEYVAFIRSMFDKASVMWQTAELGKVDVGGGGTVAMYISNHNIDTVDIGVPVLSMHAPFEVISKADLYSAHKAFSSFYR